MYLLWAGAAAAADPVAIVEDVEAAGAKVRFLDYLEKGQRIVLTRSGRIVIGYLNSCLREEIAGGEVVIGTEQSIVSGGKVSRVRVECDGGRLLLTSRQAGKGAAMVYRKAKPSSGGAPIQAALRIYSLTPLIKLSEPAASLTLERLDRPAPKIALTGKGRVYDAAANKVTLQRNGVYLARTGDRTLVFKVDAQAVEGGPLLSRLVAF